MSAEISEFLDRHARQTPNRPALRFEGHTTTFAQLQTRVARLADALTQAGLKPRADERLLVLDKNHPATVELTLACARGGFTAVIANFRLAPDEIAWTVEDSQARILVVGHELLPIIEALKPRLKSVERIITLGGPADQYEAFLARGDPSAPAAAFEPDDTFLQLYTSGTTGFPKGAMLTHRSVGAHTEVMIDQFRFDSQSVSLVPMPLFHVGGICWALLSLACGAVSVIGRDTSPAALLKAMLDEGITHAFVVPAVLHGLLALPDFAAAAPKLKLKAVAYGGSPIPLPLLERCLAVMSCDFFQVYGMTEMSGVFSLLPGPVHRDPSQRARLVSAGKITPGTEFKVVDPSTGAEVKRGELGEFWVRGPQRLKGYWRRDDETQEAITPDGWLRTGDAGRVDDEGYVFIQDRVKDMVISGGENVYPAEVERVLQQMPQVSEVAVFGVPHEKWGETLRAAIVLKPGETATELEVIAWAKQKLAGYKCPTQVGFLPALPRNPTGKVLKRELRAPFWEGRSRSI